MSIDEVATIVKEAQYGYLATSEDGQPRVRPMAFVMTEDRTFWSSTHHSSGKVREWNANEKVEIAFTDSRKYHVRVEGIVNTRGGEDAKRKLIELNPRVGRHFDGAEDPRFAHVEVVPTRIRWTEPGVGEYHDVEL